MDIVERAVGMLTNPKETWEEIGKETGGLKETFIPFAVVFFAIQPIVTLVTGSLSDIWGLAGEVPREVQQVMEPAHQRDDREVAEKPLPAPEIESAVLAKDKRIDLRWKAISDAAEYDVFYAYSSNPALLKNVGAPSAVPYTRLNASHPRGPKVWLAVRAAGGGGAIPLPPSAWNVFFSTRRVRRWRIKGTRRNPPQCAIRVPCERILF